MRRSEPELIVSNLLERLHDAEQLLLQSDGVRLRVDKVTLDGRSALCSAYQVHRRFYQVEFHAEQIVMACHHALGPIYRIGINPYITAMQRMPVDGFPPLDTNDPFRLRTALGVIGKEALLVGPSSELSMVHWVQ